ncbi:GNAT family N-acetyltransferase [Sulfitobacter sp. M57]|uniref:GNAT family N-acetyltransferase n=1 Tax=unclassified Sulfitobacter TaxID=196795 RepID=UPI0023E1C7B1|nr:MULTISPECIES: GNAT family N-acetyltransferase [unclassified Sulfitobacter]MDF3413733.1 GNAT family N-acetyltransferase [Sulfitobacter sp. KE5]MDF3420986.1 GNAT family N-acetyltransferase [Sulfitobacter sp. KE43]MDF3432279.1 GNAT family N-acetyltransferase [Sulfitobacter sp. KE42]MDF3457918.1 GNAT family N-acetyltransferase [Sulfitobacter sp. S74]MDF3461819.1 GNAT family N-acetyltransferase [Sulfitobacter sp. Ks18]
MKIQPIEESQPIIQTDRFDLRPLQRSDLGLIELYAGDVRVARNTSTIPHPLPPGTIDAFITRALSEPRDFDCWAMDGTKDNGAEVMGLITLSRLDRNQTEVGFWVAPAFWNTHLASDSVTALVEANPLRNHTMFATVFQDNPASAKVMTNAGFVYLGDAEIYCLARDAAVPTWTYSRKL